MLGGAAAATPAPAQPAPQVVAAPKAPKAADAKKSADKKAGAAKHDVKKAAPQDGMLSGLGL
jgi:hypothetical protein